MNYANYGFFSITSKATTLITRFGQNSVINSGTHNAIFGAGDTISGNSNLVFGYNNDITGNNSIYMGYSISTGSNSLIINSLRSTIQNTSNNYFNIMDIITSSNHTKSLTISRTTSFPSGIKIGSGSNDILLCQGSTNTIYIAGNLEVSGKVSGIFDITSTNCNIGGTLSVSGIISAYSNLIISYSNNTEPMLILSNTNTILASNQSIIKYANNQFQMYGILDSTRTTFGYGPSVYPSHYLFSIRKDGEIQMYKSSSDITNSNSTSTSVFKLDTEGNINISNNLIVENDLYISENLLITGITTFNNTATFDGTIIANDIVNINNNLNITGIMTVKKTATFNSNIIATSTDTFSAFKNIYITGDLQVCGTNTINKTQTLTGENNYLVINTGNSSTTASGFFIKRYQELNNSNNGYVTQNDTPIISGILPSTTPVTNNIKLFSTNPGYNVTNWIIRFTSNVTEYVRRIETYNSENFVAELNDDLPMGVNNNFTINLYDKPSVGLYYDEFSKYFKFVGGLLNSDGALSGVTSNTLFNLSLGELELVSDLYVSGTSEIAGNTNFKNNVSISNTLSVNTLSVSDKATFSNIITSNGILNMKNINENTIYYVNNEGNTFISGTLTISNTTNLQTVNVSNTLNVLNDMNVKNNAIFLNNVSFKDIVTFSNFNNIFFTGNGSSYPLSISNSLSATNSPVYIEMSNASPNSILIGMGSSNNANSKMFEILHKVDYNYQDIFYITNDYNLYFKKGNGTTLMHLNSNGDLDIAGKLTIDNLELDALTLNSNLTLFKTSLNSEEFLTLQQGSPNYPSYITFSNSNHSYQTKVEIGTYNTSYPLYISASNNRKNVFSKSGNTSDILVSLNSNYDLYVNTNLTVSGNINVNYKDRFYAYIADRTGGTGGSGIKAINSKGSWSEFGISADGDLFAVWDNNGKHKFSVLPNGGLKFPHNDSNQEISWAWNNARIYSGGSAPSNGLHIGYNGTSFPIYLDNNTIISGVHNNYEPALTIQHSDAEVLKLRRIYPANTTYGPYIYFYNSDTLFSRLGATSTEYLTIADANNVRKFTVAKTQTKILNNTYISGSLNVSGIIEISGFAMKLHYHSTQWKDTYQGYYNTDNKRVGIIGIAGNNWFIGSTPWDGASAGDMYIQAGKDKSIYLQSDTTFNGNVNTNNLKAGVISNTWHMWINIEDGHMLIFSFGGTTKQEYQFTQNALHCSGNDIQNVGNIHVNNVVYTFTGGHTLKSKDNLDEHQGKVLEIVNSSLTDINNNNVECKISDTVKSKAIYGVLNTIDYNSELETHFYDDYYYYTCNGVGEGGIIVSNANGNIEVGDYLVSDGNGYVMKQDDDIYRSSTVAKAIDNVLWENEATTTKMIGCIYLCS